MPASSNPSVLNQDMSTNTPLSGRAYRDGVAQAWGAYTTVTTTALDDSGNIASVTDNGTGDTTFTFRRAFANANYAVVLGGGGDGTTVCGLTTRAVGSFRIRNRDAANNYVDVNLNSFACFGDYV